MTCCHCMSFDKKNQTKMSQLETKESKKLENELLDEEKHLVRILVKIRAKKCYFASEERGRASSKCVSIELIIT